MTRQQSRLLQFIAEYQREHGGASPSLAEMAVALQLKSKSGVHRLLSALDQAGKINRNRYVARSIEVITVPVTVDGFCAYFDRLVAQEGAAVAAGVLCVLLARQEPRRQGAV